MVLKPLFWMVLLLLPFGGPAPAALAAAGSEPAAVGQDPEVVSPAGELGAAGANWNRDLFAIFREAPEAKRQAGGRTATEPKKSGGTMPKKLADQDNLVLQGIVVSDGSFVALVGGSIVRSGDLVAGWKVRRITRHTLVAEGVGGVRKFELLAESPKARVSSKSGER